MSSVALARWGAIGFMLGGTTWAILGFSGLVGYLQAIPGREDVVLFIAALLFSAMGLLGLHALQKESYGLLGRAGLYITLVAIAIRALGAVVFLAGSSALEWVSLPGTLGMLAGFVLYGVTTLRAKVLPLWYGLSLIAVMPVSLPLGAYGTTLFGLVLLVVGCGLWLRRGARGQTTAR